MSKDGKDPEADSDQPATPVIGTQVSKAPTPPVTDTAHGTSTRTPAPPPVRLPVQETETRSQPSAQTSTTTAVAPGGDVRSRINTTTAITPTTSAVSVQGSTVPTTSATPPQATSSPTPKTSAATAPIPTLHGTGFTLEQLTQSIAHAVETPAQNLAARSASVRSRASTTTTSTEPTPPELESGQTLGASPMLNFPTHPMSVHAREKGGQDPIIATYPTVPRESGPSRSNTLLGAAVLMCAGSLVGIWASWMRVRRQSQGSYISRAMPRAGDDRTSQRQRTRSGSNP